MLEKALIGDKKYWTWVIGLLVLIGIGVLFYIRQFNEGLGITGLGRDVTWGFYIAQFTFMVGVAASAVMVVLPYYLHNYKLFGKIVILGEFVAIPSVLVCMLFIFVDMGQPTRVLNVMLHPTPHSMMFWDMVSLMGYLLLNLIIGWTTLGAERKSIPPPKWVKPLIILSIPWAVSIHTVTAFLYSGLAARPFWMTAVLAPRFLASAFSAGPALLILFVMILRKLTRFDPGKEAIQNLGKIVTYAMCVNVFLVAMEFFTAYYSDIPEHLAHFHFMFGGIAENNWIGPWMYFSSILAIFSLLLLLVPKFRHSEPILAIACIAVFVSLWIDKGLALIVTGFVPSVLGHVPSYVPTVPELMISVAVYALGLLIVTLLYKVVLSVRGDVVQNRIKGEDVPVATKV
ncbi:MAG TPA: polysulfide reductase NrfD [candidate division Zixibacteria bacterium]|mgnify:CR=1 FL=1|nr:polysulfide reductase NrfD [candidate division Zixibacteria bacterium]